MLQQQHKEFDQHFNNYRLKDGYIKGQGNKKCNIGRLDVGVNPPSPLYFDNGINPNSGMVTALPQNESGFIGGTPGYSIPPKPVPRTANAGANSHDVSANGTEADIFSCANAGVDYTDNSECKTTIARHGLGCFRTAGGQIKWFGNWTEPVAGQEFNTDTINGKTRLTEAITSDFDKLSLHLRPGMHATAGIGNSTVIQGQGGTWEARVGAAEEEVDPEIDYISASAASGSEENEVELKQNEYNEFCNIKMDANNGKITINVTGGENQYSSTIILTGNDITCITHVFNVLAEDEIHLLAGQQKSSINMDKEQIAVQSPMILENAKTLLKMDAAMIMENCKSKAGGGAGGIAGKLASIGGKLTAVAQNVMQNITGALASSGLGGALGGMMQNGMSALGGLSGMIQNGMSALGGLSSMMQNGMSALGGLSGMMQNGMSALSGLSNIGGALQQGLGSAGDLLGKAGLGNIGGALQQGLGQAGEALGNIAGGANKAISAITQPINNAISQGMQTIDKATQTVHNAINQGTQAVGKAIEGATQGISGAMQKIGDTAQKVVSNTMGKAGSVIEKATSSVKLPSMDNIPIPILHANDLHTNANINTDIHINADANTDTDENNTTMTAEEEEQFIRQQYQIIYNYVYNTDLEEEEKQQLYIYYVTIYNYMTCLIQLNNIVVCDFPINLAALTLLNVYMQDVQDYANNINLIVQDYVNGTTHFTIKQIIHDQNDKKIQCLQMQEFLRKNVKNEIVKNEVIKLIDQYANDYIELTNHLITLINELSTIKIDLDEEEIINEDNELYDLL